MKPFAATPATPQVASPVTPAASLAGFRLRGRGGPQSSIAAASILGSVKDPPAMIAWWEALKRGRRFPTPHDLDRAAIGAAWPAVVLLSYSAEQNGIARTIRIGDRDDVQNGAVEYSPMLTEWLLALGRKTIMRGVPLDETGDFPSARGVIAYRILALPLSAGGHFPDHVLCRLWRA